MNKHFAIWDSDGSVEVLTQWRLSTDYKLEQTEGGSAFRNTPVMFIDSSRVLFNNYLLYKFEFGNTYMGEDEEPENATYLTKGYISMCDYLPKFSKVKQTGNESAFPLPTGDPFTEKIEKLVSLGGVGSGPQDEIIIWNVTPDSITEFRRLKYTNVSRIFTKDKDQIIIVRETDILVYSIIEDKVTEEITSKEEILTAFPLLNGDIAYIASKSLVLKDRIITNVLGEKKSKYSISVERIPKIIVVDHFIIIDSVVVDLTRDDKFTLPEGQIFHLYDQYIFINKEGTRKTILYDLRKRGRINTYGFTVKNIVHLNYSAPYENFLIVENISAMDKTTIHYMIDLTFIKTLSTSYYVMEFVPLRYKEEDRIPIRDQVVKQLKNYVSLPLRKLVSKFIV